MKKGLEVFILVMVVCVQVATAQSGGTFAIERSVIGSGNISGGGTFSLMGTADQPNAGGTLDGGMLSVYSGFWISQPLVPTAAPVSVSGRVYLPNSIGIRNAIVTLIDVSGMGRIALTNGFGYYTFDNVTAGATYIVTVSSRQHTFASPTRVITVDDYISDADFTAIR